MLLDMRNVNTNMITVNVGDMKCMKKTSSPHVKYSR